MKTQAKKKSVRDVIPYPEQYCPETEVLGPALAVLVELIPYPYMECEYTSATAKATVKRLKKVKKTGKKR